MEETGIALKEAEWERQQLENIEACLNTLDKLQHIFLNVPSSMLPKDDLSSMLPKDDLAKASGRRCILGVGGLKYHSYEKFFEVSPGGVRIVPPYDNFNTYISAPVDSVLRVLKGVLDGDTAAFSAEWARGQAKIVGERRIHDGYVFSEVFRRLALMIKRYRES